VHLEQIRGDLAHHGPVVGTQLGERRPPLAAPPDVLAFVLADRTALGRRLALRVLDAARRADERGHLGRSGPRTHRFSPSGRDLASLRNPPPRISNPHAWCIHGPCEREGRSCGSTGSGWPIGRGSTRSSKTSTSACSRPCTS